MQRRVLRTGKPLHRACRRACSVLRPGSGAAGAPGPGRQAGLSHLSFPPSSGGGLLRLRCDSAGEVDAVGVVDDAVEDGIGDGGLANGIPIRLRGLADLNGAGSWSRMRSIP